MKKKFDIQHWMQQSEPEQNLPGSKRPGSVSKSLSEPVQNLIRKDLGVTDVETIIQRLESAHTDITASYPDWRDIGFAFADKFGKAGREYFHRVSRYYPGYSQSDCNKQYDKCLKSSGHGVTIKSFFHLAQQAGISLVTTQQRTNPSASIKPDGVSKSPSEHVPKLIREDLGVNEEPIFNTPRIPSEVYSQLPEILRDSCEMFADAIEKDVFLIGAIAVISGSLPNIEGIYFDEPHSAHLYSFITAPAGSGKGKLKWAKFFGLRIHKTMVEQSIREKEDYEQEMENYNNLNKNQRQGVERPREPKRKMFYIPANSSASAFIQALSDNNFKGIIFETEADTLAGTLKQDWGNFSDVLRKAFHHESTNMFRRKDNEHIEVEDPHLAIVLSGTPKQVHNMMPDVENGLFSRFLYYAFEDYSDFKNPFISHQKVNYTDFFEAKGEQMYDLYQTLADQPSPFEFRFTAEQGEVFTEEFNALYKRNRMLLGNDFNANSRRLGLITFRIAMVLRTLRILEDGDYSNPLICNETDFQTAIQIAFTLEKHAIAVFQNLPNNNLKGVKLKFYNALPDNFNRQDYLSVAKDLNIKEKTAEKYIGQFKGNDLLDHEHNHYKKK
ncbi:Primase C terminal 2 (PriCT-2) [Draconibacterium orientale]|uniref:DNA primase n=1 Tax=Draconibacterium orientale TaxID=1168034 RepID=X5E343_9BACT|nr:DUF3987 domain-containing protein [Draconibacterium orientale]AHW61041.1 DNA primase [Draconibacterium orientale]SET55274.1 Primase C terminal 2 (PriCT-2) [Draconibacterium orientale]